MARGESAFGDLYMHYTVCHICGNENNGVLSHDKDPWVIGAAWCPRCCLVFRIQPNHDRSVFQPVQLDMFSQGNRK